MTRKRLEATRATILACAIVLIVTLAGCGSPAVASVASPTAGVGTGASAAPTVTPDSGTATGSAGAEADAPSATAIAASPTLDQATPVATAASSVASPVATPSAEAIQGAVAAPAAVPLFLTVTSPAGDLLEVPSGTAEVAISGKTVPSAVLSVNGNLVIPDGSGNFQVTVPVTGDVTLVEVVASGVTGAEIHVQRVIVRD